MSILVDQTHIQLTCQRRKIVFFKISLPVAFTMLASNSNVDMSNSQLCFVGNSDLAGIYVDSPPS